ARRDRAHLDRRTNRIDADFQPWLHLVEIGRKSSASKIHGLDGEPVPTIAAGLEVEEALGRRGRGELLIRAALVVGRLQQHLSNAPFRGIDGEGDAKRSLARIVDFRRGSLGLSEGRVGGDKEKGKTEPGEARSSSIE